MEKYVCRRYRQTFRKVPHIFEYIQSPGALYKGPSICKSMSVDTTTDKPFAHASGDAHILKSPPSSAFT